VLRFGFCSNRLQAFTVCEIGLEVLVMGHVFCLKILVKGNFSVTWLWPSKRWIWAVFLCENFFGNLVVAR
jgi:hypothetical protein